MAVARDLSEALAADIHQPGQYIAMRFNLGFESRLQIYLLEPSGQDVLGRKLPSTVQRLLSTSPVDRALMVLGNRRLVEPDMDLGGYRVIGYLDSFPTFLLRPGERPSMLVAMLLVSAIVSYILARFIVRPVRHLRQAGQRVAAGDLSVRVAHTVGDRKDDIAMLARDFDAMTTRIDGLLRTQQRLMRDVSHELRSPLTRLQALQSLARQRFTDKDETHILERMETESERLNQLIEEILSLSRLDMQQAVKRQNTDLADLLQTIIDDVTIEIGPEDKRVEYQGPDRLNLKVDAALIHSAIENVVRNAVRFTPLGDAARIVLETVADRALVVIEDAGPGVPPEALVQLFDPFFQVDDSRSPDGTGSGVGLAIAQRAIELHQGQIHAENRSSGGLRVTIDLPKS